MKRPAPYAVLAFAAMLAAQYSRMLELRERERAAFTRGAEFTAKALLTLVPTEAPSPPDPDPADPARNQWWADQRAADHA